MKTSEFLYWANMPEEDKQGKFMTFGALRESHLEQFVECMSLIESADYIMVPLDQVELIRNEWLLDVHHLAVAVVDVPFMTINKDMIVANVKHLDKEWC